MMTPPPPEPDDAARQMVCMPLEYWDDMLARAADKGATEALRRLGLDDATAASDIRTLRGFARFWAEAGRRAAMGILGRIGTAIWWIFVLGIAAVIYTRVQSADVPAAIITPHKP